MKKLRGLLKVKLSIITTKDCIPVLSIKHHIFSQKILLNFKKSGLVEGGLDKVPSRSVIAGVMQNINFKELENIFYQWSLQFISIKKSDWLNLDGKVIRGTVTNPNDKLQNFVSLITVFVNKRKQVLAVKKINNKKESEIPTVRELIKGLGLKDMTFTLDALHCQKKTVKAITRSQNDYCIGVKRNQKNLSEVTKKL